MRRVCKGNPWNSDLDFLIEIHLKDGFRGGEVRFRISGSIAKSEIWISQSNPTLGSKESNFCCSSHFGSTWQTAMWWELHFSFQMEAMAPILFSHHQILWNCDMHPNILNFGGNGPKSKLKPCMFKTQIHGRYFWNTYFFIQISLLSTQNQWIHTPKPHIFETAPRSEWIFLIRQVWWICVGDWNRISLKSTISNFCPVVN